jgi:hypothetical protein
MKIGEALVHLSKSVNSVSQEQRRNMELYDLQRQVKAELDVQNIVKSHPHYDAEAHVPFERVREVTIDGTTVHLR